MVWASIAGDVHTTAHGPTAALSNDVRAHASFDNSNTLEVTPKLLSGPTPSDMFGHPWSIGLVDAAQQQVEDVHMDFWTKPSNNTDDQTTPVFFTQYLIQTAPGLLLHI